MGKRDRDPNKIEVPQVFRNIQQLLDVSSNFFNQPPALQVPLPRTAKIIRADFLDSGSYFSEISGALRSTSEIPEKVFEKTGSRKFRFVFTHFAEGRLMDGDTIKSIDQKDTVLVVCNGDAFKKVYCNPERRDMKLKNTPKLIFPTSDNIAIFTMTKNKLSFYILGPQRDMQNWVNDVMNMR